MRNDERNLLFNAFVDYEGGNIYDVWGVSVKFLWKRSNKIAVVVAFSEVLSMSDESVWSVGFENVRHYIIQ